MSPKSIIQLTENLKSLYMKTAKKLKESDRRRLNDSGYTLKRVLKTKSIKKIPETEAIFEQVEQINTEADK
ncbi:MAG: hypothetical protein V7L29_32040 [Nostoc sp.]